MTEKIEAEAAVVARVAREGYQPTIVELRHADVSAIALFAPDGDGGLRLHDVKPILDKFRSVPERKEGTSTHEDLESFCEHIHRHKDADSTLWMARGADGSRKAGITAVYDYNKAGADGSPRFGQHRAHYPFPFSVEWEAWKAKNGVSMDVGTFAGFLEDRIADVLPTPLADNEADAPLLDIGRQLAGTFAGPERLMDLSRGLQVHTGGKVANAITMQSGEMQVVFEETHRDATGAPIKVPSLFVIGIPVFYLGPVYRIAARLRYRLKEGVITWSYHLHRLDNVREHAMDEVAAKVTEATDLPLFYGAPEN